MSKYPKVNYIGNKEKLTDWIIENLPLKDGVVLDIFSGGASVSFALKKAGFSVVSNDVLYSNYILSKALIENNGDLLNENVFDIEIKKEEIEKKYQELKFLVNKLYFDYEVKELAKLLLISEQIKEYERYIFLALLRRAMIRKLPYSRMNVPWNQITKLRDEEYSYEKYGRRRSYHNWTFETHMKLNLNEFNNAIFTNDKENKAFRLDVIDLLNSEIENVDIIYLDPPYPSTMNNYDAFYGSFDRMFGKEINTHLDFTNKNSFISNMKILLDTCKGKTKYIVLSLNNKSEKITMELKDLLSSYGRLEILEQEHVYKVTGKENKNATKELLYIVELAE